MRYESGRSLDDQPLAAYGGSGMELTDEDEVKIEAAPLPDAAPETEAIEPVPPGAFAHATTVDNSFDDSLERPPDRPALVALEGLAAVASRMVTLLRTSRVAAGAAFGGVIVVGLALLLGSTTKPGAASADASPSAAPVVTATREPGNATLVLTGQVEQEITFTTSSGGADAGAPLAVTWTDPTTNSLGLVGAVDRGTRSTDEALVLQWTVMVKEKPITFTSTDGECTLGMGVVGTRVQGTFTCKKLKSDDGKYVVGATGSYRT
ncbi:MAG TPA: hypothetical protein VFP56_09705 [Candidatus Limnocylindrales bacterium]|nr:hypothetical protein [Candidatus Limnocylindrales bacterium]